MNRKPVTQKDHIKKELKKLFRSMDFVSNNFLSDEKAAGKDFLKVKAKK